MNTLSWLLLLAEILGNLGVMLVVLSVIAAIGVTSYMLFGALTLSDKYGVEDSEWRDYWRRSIRFGIAVLILFSLAVIMPSKNTVYMIAASQIGEQIVQTPDAKELYGDLKAKLKDILSTSTDDKDKK